MEHKEFVMALKNRFLIPKQHRNKIIDSSLLSCGWEIKSVIATEELMSFSMGNCITLEDTNGNRKLFKKRHDQKIDAVAALMDAYVAYKLNLDAEEDRINRLNNDKKGQTNE